MAEEKKCNCGHFTTVLLVINTILLVMIFGKMFCSSKAGFCPFSKKVAYQQMNIQKGEMK